jgi:hypothetical protein
LPVKTRALPFLLASVLLVAPLAVAQDFRATLIGTVVDVSGGRLAGARVALKQPDTSLERRTICNEVGEFRFDSLAPGNYQMAVSAAGFADALSDVLVAISSSPTITVTLHPQSVRESVRVEGTGSSFSAQALETTSSVEKSVITHQDLAEIPLAARSFANVAYLSPMTEPVEPSDPTKARITAVSFGGSSGLNVDLSVDGGDNNDDYIGGFLQGYSPDAIQEFVVRTAQFDADTSRTNGGSVIITTRRGTDVWHGGGAFYYRGAALNARNSLDNPTPNPKQPFGRENYVGTIGGPVKREKLWFFSSLEYVKEDASVAYSADSLKQFNALAQLAADGLIPNVNSIPVPTSVPVPFRDALYTGRLDWSQSPRSQWFLRGSLERNNTDNNLIQQAALPSTGAATNTDYYSILIGQQSQFTNNWLGALTLQANSFHLTQARNSHLGLALAFPFTATFITTSGLETFGDSQFATPITAFPVRRDQQKYQFRYDVSHTSGHHAPKFGINFVHEPVLAGALASDAEMFTAFANNPDIYLANQATLSQFAADLICNVAATNPSLPNATPGTTCRNTPAGDGTFSQSVRRLGFYGQDSWRIGRSFTLNYGLRYDTTFGLFNASGRDQSQNPALITLKALGIPLVNGVPHDYRKAFSPRLGFAYAPGQSANTVIRGGVGLYYNDLAQNGWVNAFQAANAPPGPCKTIVDPGCLGPGQQGALIDPNYHSPYALQASFGVEHSFRDWHIDAHYVHEQGVHQYRRYEYAGGVTLLSPLFPGQNLEPNVSLFRTDNRSRYDGVSFLVQHRLSKRFELTAHYTLASASTWGAVVGELFDYVNGVSDVRNPFGPGDHGPSGEDIRHRFVLAGVFLLPYKFEVSTLSQVESARPFTIATPVDVNNDGISTNDRAVINGVQTSLDQFRGTPLIQIDLRVSREFQFKERFRARPFAEFFNLLNRTNPGNNYVANIAGLPTPPVDPANATHLCLNPPSCTQVQPITSLNQVRVPAGALGDFFGPGTTVGIPFAAQVGVRVNF